VTDTDTRRDRMRDDVRRWHAGQTRNGGRLPYWVHTDAVADICEQALRRFGELPPDEAEDVVLAAYGHDLYEDTAAQPAVIRERYGDRVDGWIEGMSNRRGDSDRSAYLRHLAGSDDETRVIKCADLIDNMLSVAYGLHDLGLDWARDFFLPIAEETREVLVSTPSTRLPRTGAHLTGLVEWAWARLAGSLETAAAVAESTTATVAES
jgi:(p)ppGpp synthase/HD superfamily hydrolase